MWVKQKKKKATILLLKFLPLVGFVFFFFCWRACVKNKQVSRAQPPSNVGGVVVNEFFSFGFFFILLFFFFCAVFLWGKAPPRRLFNEVPERQRFLGTYARLYIFLCPARIVWIFTSSRLQFWAGWHSAIAPSWAELSQVELSAGLKVPTARLTGGWSFTWFKYGLNGVNVGFMFESRARLVAFGSPFWSTRTQSEWSTKRRLCLNYRE